MLGYSMERGHQIVLELAGGVMHAVTLGYQSWTSSDTQSVVWLLVVMVL